MNPLHDDMGLLIVYEGAMNFGNRNRCIFGNEFQCRCFSQVNRRACLDDVVLCNWDTEAIPSIELGRGLECQKAQEATDEGVVDCQVFGTFMLGICFVTDRQGGNLLGAHA